MQRLSRKTLLYVKTSFYSMFQVRRFGFTLIHFISMISALNMSTLVLRNKHTLPVCI